MTGHEMARRKKVVIGMNVQYHTDHQGDPSPMRDLPQSGAPEEPCVMGLVTATPEEIGTLTIKKTED